MHKTQPNFTATVQQSENMISMLVSRLADKISCVTNALVLLFERLILLRSTFIDLVHKAHCQ